MNETAASSVDLVLATVGRTDDVARFFDSLSTQRFTGFRVIVVDQNDDARLSPIVAAYADRLSLLHVRAEPGLSRARNIGLGHVTAGVVAFPDDDCWYPPDLLAQVTDALDANRGWDGLTGRAVDADGKASGARWDSSPGLVTRANVWTRGVSITVFLRRTVIDAVGGFDETLGLGAGTPWGSGEETDYLLRALRRGFRIQYDPSVVVGHPQTWGQQTSPSADAGYRYGSGMGRVMRLNRYGPSHVAYHCMRAVGGCGLALAARRPLEARFYWAVARGRLRGWRSAPPKVRRVGRQS